MAEAANVLAETTEDAARFLTFRMADRLYALSADQVSEVIRLPAVARVPQGPPGLLGIANLRGAVLPVASLRGLLGQPEQTSDGGARVIVLAGDGPLGLAVDSVDALVSVDLVTIETRQAELASLPGERLGGAFQPVGGEDVAKILDVKSLVAAAFVVRSRPQRTAIVAESLAGLGAAGEDDDQRLKLVTFDVAGQEFALPLEVVSEIVPAPAATTAVPRSEALVLGMMSYRDSLLPLLSLRGLLGLGAPVGDDRERVVVTVVGGVLVGLVAERMRAIVSADPALIEPTPALLAARTGGETQIASIYRGEGGARLISILAPDQLFREDVMVRLSKAGKTPVTHEAAPAATSAMRQFLVFQLGGDEFALPIEVVDEVARAPTRVTRLPKAPAFLEGVINLRGEVLPVVDQRRRFNMPPTSDLDSRRLIVVRTQNHRAGLIVDAVSEVLRSAVEAIEPAPDLAGETTRLVHGVINLEAAGRMILLLDPAELLTRTERSLLDAFQVVAAGDEAGYPEA